MVAASRGRRPKSSVFSDGFEFAEVTDSDWRVDVNWSVDEDVLAMAKKKQVRYSQDAGGMQSKLLILFIFSSCYIQRPVFTSLDAKIARAKEIRKLKVSSDSQH